MELIFETLPRMEAVHGWGLQTGDCLDGERHPHGQEGQPKPGGLLLEGMQ